MVCFAFLVKLSHCVRGFWQLVQPCHSLAPDKKSGLSLFQFVPR